MTTVDSTGENRQTRPPDVDLDRRYGRIAISALVAALPYGGECKTQASKTPAPKTQAPKTQAPVSKNPHKYRAA